MSIPPLVNYDDLALSFEIHLQGIQNDYAHQLKKAPQNVLLALIGCLNALRNVNKELKSKHFSHITQEEIDVFDRTVHQKVSQIAELAQTHLSSEQNLFGLLDNISKEIQKSSEHFIQILLHENVIKAKGVEAFLQHDWLKEELHSLVFNKYPTAMNAMEKWLESGIPLGQELLIRSNREEKYFNQYAHEAWFAKDFVKTLYSEDTQQPNKHAFTILRYLISQRYYPWIENLCREFIKNPDDYQQNILTWAFVGQGHIQTWMMPSVFQWFQEGNKWAVMLAYEFITHAKEQDVKDFSECLINLCKGQLHLQQALACMAVLVSEQSPFFDCLNQKIDEGLLHTDVYPNDRIRASFGRLWDTYYDIFGGAEEKESGKVNLPFIKRYDSFMLMMKRQERLCQFLSNIPSELPKYLQPTITDSFPRAERLLVGLHNKVVTSHSEHYLNYIAKHLAPFHVKVSFLRTSDPAEKIPAQLSDNLDAHNCVIKVGPWVRDSCIAHPSGFRFPHLFPLVSDKIEMLVKKTRRERVDKSILDSALPAGTIGCVSYCADPFGLFLNFQHSEKFRIDPQHSLCFTYGEGGNTLTGESEEGPYAIIGKDTLELNRHCLSQELQELGWAPLGTHRWEKQDPHSEHELFLSDENMQDFFAADLGIDPKHIYFVENIAYHIDIAMAILVGKTVAINDSLLAFETWQEYADLKMKEEGFKFDPKRYDKRLARLKEIAISRQPLENLAAQQLFDQGFNVIRVGGLFENIFEDVPVNHRINLFNFISLTSPSSEAEKVVIGLGADPFFQKKFEDMFKEHIPINRIIYLDEHMSRYIQSLDGGLHCCIRPI